MNWCSSQTNIKKARENWESEWKMTISKEWITPIPFRLRSGKKIAIYVKNIHRDRSWWIRNNKLIEIGSAYAYEGQCNHKMNENENE